LHKPVTHISLILNNLATTKLSIAQIPHCIIESQENSYYRYSFSNDDANLNGTITANALTNIVDTAPCFAKYLSSIGQHSKSINGFLNASAMLNISLELDLIDNISAGEVHCFAVTYNILQYKLDGTAHLITE
jgi:uncharacterized protein CbrC (UPF0167 family)